MTPVLVLHLCSPCLADRLVSTVEALSAALDAAGVAARVEAGPCLGPCDSPVALVLQGNGAACVFAGVRLPADTADIVATCRTYRDAHSGWIEDARPCGRLRFCLRTRIPGGREQ